MSADGQFKRYEVDLIWGEDWFSERQAGNSYLDIFGLIEEVIGSKPQSVIASLSFPGF